MGMATAYFSASSESRMGLVQSDTCAPAACEGLLGTQPPRTREVQREEEGWAWDLGNLSQPCAPGEGARAEEKSSETGTVMPGSERIKDNLCPAIWGPGPVEKKDEAVVSGSECFVPNAAGDPRPNACGKDGALRILEAVIFRPRPRGHGFRPCICPLLTCSPDGYMAFPSLPRALPHLPCLGPVAHSLCSSVCCDRTLWAHRGCGG
ncbi:hypothetical protein GHT09_005961 [Marmota monax]|uniref:Uncharacterized protein n=1 Tax=Marmota monax TaxID=9995 RepID=A0A834QR22_MARMO|nr:hypothetical protein GHT09_005961 [Marmota monax]